MSEKTPNPALSVATDENQQDDTETNPTRRQRAAAFIAKHKKPLIAAGLLGGVVGLASLSGRKSATVTVQSPLELDVYDPESVETESTDTVTA